MNKPFFNELIYAIPKDQKIKIETYDEKNESVKVLFIPNTKIELDDTLKDYVFYYHTIMQIHAEFIDGETVIVITV